MGVRWVREVIPTFIPPSQRHDIPWNDKQIARFKFRAALLQRRGLAEEVAEAWADRLAVRDSDRDNRRLCVECSNYQRSRTCAKRLPTSPLQLACCHGFSFVTP